MASIEEDECGRSLGSGGGGGDLGGGNGSEGDGLTSCDAVVAFDIVTFVVVVLVIVVAMSSLSDSSWDTAEATTSSAFVSLRARSKQPGSCGECDIAAKGGPALVTVFLSCGVLFKRLFTFF